MNRAQRAPERFLTTVLMTDIVGSTEHIAELGDRAWRDLVQVHHATVRAALNRHRGHEVDTAGDGFFATFDAPAAAVDCALEVAERVREIGLDIRAGVHVGEVEQVAGKVGGITVPIAARIMAAASGGEVLVSATVRDLAAGAGFRFDDRGPRDLKGIPGEWRIFAASRTDAAAAAPTVAAAARATGVAARRRAAAVRNIRSRPMWRRHPRVSTGLAALGLAVAATVALLVWRPWQPPALAAIGEDAIGVIDAGRREIIASIPVGARPGAIVVGDGVAWVAITGYDTVVRVDLATRQVTREIDVGRAPSGLALVGGSVWVANSSERSVTRINVDTARVVDTIEVGNRPIAVAAGGDGVWVAHAGDSTVVRLDPATGEPGDPIPVAGGPVAIAADDTGVWVASADAASLTHLDARTGVTQAAPISLPARPTAVALASGSVWVAAGDGTLTRVDQQTSRVTQTLDVGGSPSGITVDGAALWVADREGYVHRIDTAISGTPARVETAAAPEAVASAAGELLVSGRASAASHRGGALRVLFVRYDALDPVVPSPYNAAYFQADGLVGYRRVGGAAGTELMPALATAIPRPGDGGRTWTFQLRPDLVYPDGNPVLASDFRRAFERSFQVGPPPFGAVGGFYWPTLIGADECLTPDLSPVQRCDLTDGVVADDKSRTVTFRLEEPDGDFLAKLTLTAAYPVPEGVPMNEVISGAFPGTGPYTLASATETEVRFARNPRFRVLDERVRPDGVPDTIVVTVLPPDAPPEDRVAMIVEGEADYMPLRGPSRLPPELLAQVSRQYPGQLHFGPTVMTYVYLNVAQPPFDEIDVRRAVNLALDRARIVEASGGAPGLSVACQALPPAWPGHQPYCPYTASPDAGGRWQEPDLAAARLLVEETGTKGMSIRVGPVREQHLPVQEELVGGLEALGYDVTVEPTADGTAVFEALDSGAMQVGVFDWLQDYLAPSTFLSSFQCEQAAVSGYPCDERLDALITEAIDLQATDPAAAAQRWAAADRALADLAYWAPVYLSGADMVSERVGNVQFHPAYFVLLDQLWVR